MKEKLKQGCGDVLFAIAAGLVVAVGYYFFQNSNGFAPGGVGGLATITYHLLGYRVSGGQMTVVPEEAELVRLIFHRYALEQMGISPENLFTVSTSCPSVSAMAEA